MNSDSKIIIETLDKNKSNKINNEEINDEEINNINNEEINNEEINKIDKINRIKNNILKQYPEIISDIESNIITFIDLDNFVEDYFIKNKIDKSYKQYIMFILSPTKLKI